MWKFIKYECRHWLGSPMLWIFIGINTLLVMGDVSSDNFTIGGGAGAVHENAPYVIQHLYGVMSLLCLLMTTAFMNATANRDFQYNMYQFVFSSPIKKYQYYFGKFIGAVIPSVLALTGVSLGVLIGPLMPWVEDPARYGDVIWSAHLHGLLSFGIPNTIITGVWMYCLAIIFRSSMVSFIGSMLILVLYAVSQGFTRDIEKEWLANILDPFGFRPESLIAKYLTVDEKNVSTVPLSGAFLVNRLLWLGIALAILLLGYFRFSFNTRKERAARPKKIRQEAPPAPVSQASYEPTAAGRFSLRTLLFLTRYETKAIIKNPTFIIIVAIGLINLIANLTSFTGGYGADQYPVTYDVIDSIRGSFFIFLIAIITFYSGVLVWKERDAKINEIQDATPVPTGMLFSSKVAAMIVSLGLILCCTILVGLIAQTAFGYTNYQLGVYIRSLLVLDLLSFSYFTVIALLFHYLINNRYIAYFAFVVFVILNSFIWTLFEVDTNMVDFGNTPTVTYSDMNGYGPFVKSAVWFNLYWFLCCAVLLFVVFAFYVRGKEMQFSVRMVNARKALNRNRLALLCSFVLFTACAAFVYYNTKVLNTYISGDERERRVVDYEKTYKKYQHLAQPRYTRLDYAIDLVPEKRNLSATVKAWIRNKSAAPIAELHLSMPGRLDSTVITVPGSRLKLRDNRLGYRIYSFNKAMAPGDSVQLTVTIVHETKGFENEVSFTQLTENGTFFNSGDLLPTIGYDSGNELTDKNKRVKYKLPKRERMPRLNERNLEARRNIYITSDADLVDVNTVISTAPDQVAIAPGSLLKTWDAGGRKYFHYRLDHPSWNFYSFLSARYDVARKTFKGINTEVYHIPQHAYNVPNMQRSLEKSLGYYIANFGPYYHKQCRIIEFPRYASFAQAFPGTMPYSESIGFIEDLRHVTEDDIDAVYYVVAHEMGHQYWAHQLCGANMQGSEMMSEGFAQYSALMVMEKEYGKDKMKKFLKYEMDGYLAGRGREAEAERPLMYTEHQPYIYYQKASVVLYYLKEMIGEGKVNGAMRSLIDSFAYRASPYPTSMDAVRAFRKATPDSLQYLIHDLFETITLFSNRTLEATYRKDGSDYLVTLKTHSEKFRADTLGKETAVPVSDYIDIGVFAKSESKKNLGKALVMKRMKLTQGENTFTFRVKEKPQQAGIDPYNYLVDRVPGDNVKALTEEEK